SRVVARRQGDDAGRVDGRLQIVGGQRAVELVQRRHLACAGAEGDVGGRAAAGRGDRERLAAERRTRAGRRLADAAGEAERGQCRRVARGDAQDPVDGTGVQRDGAATDRGGRAGVAAGGIDRREQAGDGASEADLVGAGGAGHEGQRLAVNRQRVAGGEAGGQRAVAGRTGAGQQRGAGQRRGRGDAAGASLGGDRAEAEFSQCVAASGDRQVGGGAGLQYELAAADRGSGAAGDGVDIAEDGRDRSSRAGADADGEAGRGRTARARGRGREGDGRAVDDHRGAVGDRGGKVVRGGAGDADQQRGGGDRN